jgi:3D-(3,5/4)-trihydroxycyclohexane-1,2-dione acylhydrolase (decyclizing)
VDELKTALEDAKKQKVSTLVEMNVLPTMADVYDSWWNVGVAEVSNKESIQKALKSEERTEIRKTILREEG